MKTKTFFKRIPKSFYTVASLSALAAINYTIIHSSFVFLALLVLVVHELGHYFISKKEGADASLPIFLPLPFIAIGITRVKGLSTRSKMKVSLSGPLFGFAAAILLLLLNFLYSFTSNILLLALAFSELFLNFIGTDGKKYREARKELNTCIC